MQNTDHFTHPSVQGEVKSLLSSLEALNEGQAFINMKIDFLDLCFTEFISSKCFTELDSNRRKYLFEQYTQLGTTLERLHDFNKMYPEGIEFREYCSPCIQ